MVEQKEEEQQQQKEEEQQHQQAAPVLFSLSALRDSSLSSPALHCHRLSSVVPFARDLAGRFPSCAFHFHLAPDTTLDAIRDLEAAVRPRRVEFTKYSFNATVEEGPEEAREDEVELQVGGNTGSATDNVGSAAQSDGGLANDNATPNQVSVQLDVMHCGEVLLLCDELLFTALVGLCECDTQLSIEHSYGCIWEIL